MATLRYSALEIVQTREPAGYESPGAPISEYFGANVFGLAEMRAALAPDVFKTVSTAIAKGKKIDSATADAVASAVKAWAIDRGVTTFTHWFQPMTGSTAEKHDTFFNPQKGIEVMKGSALVQQEPDASSFPNGGIRSTFEARGYTGWDPSSPIFILGTTLCIPTIFVSYTGESLDFKAPLLKAVHAIDKAATAVCKLFDRNVTNVSASLGWEQEYFVVDKALHDSRPDLVMCGRTVYGHSPARGQQLDDHYFGSIPSRVYDFMRDFEYECHLVGIPVMTRHNEVAPSQFEVAPMFEEVNVGADHNQLLMNIMEIVAERHGLKVLFHEKPFAELNGSGKHNNWSLVTNTGVNLYQPSSSARENLLFLTFLVNTIKAVYDYSDLLRASIASAGNDYRLGANEAPPAIISIFLGSTLTDILDELENNGNVRVEKGDNLYMKLGIDKIPELILDNTDRNRTSPFAFTGNKFEFRAVGGNANVAGPMTALNLAVADQLTQFSADVDAAIKGGKEKRIAIIDVLRGYVKASRAVLFEADGYSDDWRDEAARRGLTNEPSSARALQFYLKPEIVEAFEKHGVMSHREVEARVETFLEAYIMNVQIESRVMGDLALNHVLPTAIAYQNKLITNAKGLADLGLDNSSVKKTISRISDHMVAIRDGVYAMIEERKRINAIDDVAKQAEEYCDSVKLKYFEEIRYHVDKLELYVDDEDWPLTKYRELLFVR